MNFYDTTKPRFSFQQPFDIDCPNQNSFARETLSLAEAEFWASLDYIVTVAEWNGKIFKQVGEIK